MRMCYCNISGAHALLPFPFLMLISGKCCCLLVVISAVLTTSKLSRKAETGIIIIQYLVDTVQGHLLLTNELCCLTHQIMCILSDTDCTIPLFLFYAFVAEQYKSSTVEQDPRGGA